MTSRKDKLKQQLNLVPLSQEGGFFRETYRSNHEILNDEGNKRQTLTVIYYLISQDAGGRDYLHQNKSDHVHFFHCGWPLEYTIVTPSYEIKKIVLGPDPSKGDAFQLTVPGNYLKATRLMTERNECKTFPNEIPFALISEAVTPGFEYEDRFCYNEELVKKLPKEIWAELTELIPLKG
ncbi:uncharacterized protein YML079W-like [Dendronephthya gigantea]|uniref:uncharacterized protein YML079W-like n=1 Tax=Dendronephthya gigantea TaxID=151771 RepID=UPI00106A55EF|nr:uncharacterized protein YML079W-like [Dendronephthya gigantea]